MSTPAGVVCVLSQRTSRLRRQVSTLHTEEDESGFCVGVECATPECRRPRESVSHYVDPYTTAGLLCSQRLGTVTVYVNLENLTNIMQSRFDQLLLPTAGEGGRRTVGEWAPRQGALSTRACNSDSRTRPQTLGQKLGSTIARANDWNVADQRRAHSEPSMSGQRIASFRRKVRPVAASALTMIGVPAQQRAANMAPAAPAASAIPGFAGRRTAISRFGSADRTPNRYEQKTQQWPAFGFKRAWQPAHS
jgi:hypothetical protein